MWPFSRIASLEAENEGLRTRNVDLELRQNRKDAGVTRNMAELDFLRSAIKPYVVYAIRNETESIGWNFSIVHRFYPKRTLQQAECDITRLKFYISVLEAELGEDKIGAARKVCEKLRCLCTKDVPAIESAKT